MLLHCSDWVASPLVADAVDRTPFSFDDDYGAVGRKTIGPATWPARFFHPLHEQNNRITRPGPANDSYVTMGYGVGAAAATNGTALDPGFGSGLGGSIPVGAGWYNGNPNNEQTVSSFGGGLAGISGYAVMIGQFVWADTGNGVAFCLIAEMGSNTGAGTDVDFGASSFQLCPTPGALALLGLGGLATRRRRG